MTFLISAIMGGAVGWILFLFFQKLEKEHLRAQWFFALKQIQKEGPLLVWNRPLIPFFGFLFKGGLFEKQARKLSSLLQLSGADRILNPSEFLSWSFCLAWEGILIAALLFGFSFFSLFIGLLVGAGYPFLWLTLKKTERWRLIRKDLPLVMDLLALSVGAGLDMMQAIQKMVKLLPATPLLTAFEEVLSDLKLGQTRKESLQHFKEKMPLPEIRQFVALLLQAIQLGTPLAPVLLASAEQMRTERFLEVERLGIKASQKILLPLIFCILPSVFLTIFAPLGIRFLTKGFEGFL
ncbi:MAG: hypothetical protein A3H42_00165 [Deltaproteobacteria bacterium RIFCSPLOWO2_02_FULL_46_8]|nr:MAG: hypothetical protein A3H42_00165 [Deltaproteobacteria bacterium RIFCSPLOWO2_02_FULL_46_8]